MAAIEKDVRRIVRWFQREPGNAVVGETELHDITLPKLQTLFGVPAHDPMYDSWLVREEHVQGLLPFLSIELEFELERYHYFVEAEAS